MKEREKIELSIHVVRTLIDENYDEEDGYIEDEILDYNYIEEDVVYTDMEKSYKTIDVIIQRKSDDKFFRFNYSESSYNSFEDMNNKIFTAYEVFPEVINTTIYK